MLFRSVVGSDCPLSELLKEYKSFPQMSDDVEVFDKKLAMSGVEELAEELSEKLSVRIVVRPSGTENLIRIMAEGENAEQAKKACGILHKKITENLGLS